MELVGHCVLCRCNREGGCFKAPYSDGSAALFVEHAVREHGVRPDVLARTWCPPSWEPGTGAWLLPPASMPGGNHVGVPWLQVYAR